MRAPFWGAYPPRWVSPIAWALQLETETSPGSSPIIPEHATTGTFSVPIQKIHVRYTETLRGDDGVYQVTYEVSGQ